MSEDEFWIPRTLDDPNLLFMWEADNAMIWIGFVLFGSIMNMFLLGVVLAYAFGRGYAKLKEEGGTGLITKLIYWYAPSSLMGANEIPSHQREYIS